ncbi:hypothetical protein CLV56_0436 [Mumia flava]|uniref:Uncharacterized protein n=1 Tax=Mumia flava TaxID=1348852 RepID=A0A0B2BLU5_9ACTN|nr:hypothetical protein [Mumia flava]PJJ56232.1 hypothetical protein CLV56_0436 [Mumia flava]
MTARRTSPRRLVGLGRRAVVLELALYRALARWITRRPDVPAGTTPIGYAQLAAPMMWLWIFGSATEVVVVEVVLRQIDAGWAEAIRLPILVIGIWGLVWMLGMLAAHRVRPHLLSDGLLRIRAGALTWVELPLTAIGSARTAEHQLPGVIRDLHHEDDLLLVGVSSRTNVELLLEGPTVLRTSQGEMRAERVGLWADDPRTVARTLSRREPAPDRPQ